MKTEQEIIDEVCKPYGGFVNVINKCGGTLVSQLWIKSMQQYAQLSEAREAPTDELPTLKELDTLDASILSVDPLKLDVVIKDLRQQINNITGKVRSFLSTQKPEEGKEPDNTLNCNCTSDRETPMINGKHICSICNKPLY